MNKKEIAEIKKNFTEDSGFFTVGKVLSAVIDSEKNIAYDDTRLFALMPPDESELVLQLLKKTLSGTLGKNLREYAFPQEQYSEGGSQKLLYDLLTSKLADDELNKQYLSLIAQKLDYVSSYCVFTAHCTYTALKKKSKNIRLEEIDAEPSLDYNFLITAFCPIDLRIDGLVYNDGSGRIEKKAESDRIVGQTADGFLFPVFSEREPDVNSVMYYARAFKKPDLSIVEDLLGCEFTMSAPDERTTFQRILANVMHGSLDYDTITEVNDKLGEMVAYNVNETEPAKLDADGLKNILWSIGAPQENLERVKPAFSAIAEDKPLTAANLIERKTVVEAEGITVNIGSDSTDKVKMQMINGKKTLIIALDDDVTVNGLNTDEIAQPSTDK